MRWKNLFEKSCVSANLSQYGFTLEGLTKKEIVNLKENVQQKMANI